jgi:thermitase
LIRDLTTLPEVVYAEPNGIARPASLVYPNDSLFEAGNQSEKAYPEPNGVAQPASPLYPNDPLFELGFQWGLYNHGQSGGTPDADIDAPEAWEIFTGSPNVKIGIIDGGVENWHEDLSGKVSGDSGWGWGGQGFHVAGIAAAKTNNDTGIAGVDWNARIISQRIDNVDDPGIYDAIMDAVNAGADVLNNSWQLTNPDGSARYSLTVRKAFANAYKLNRVAVAAMGDGVNCTIQYPAAFGQGIIAVGATDRNDLEAFFTCTGNHIDVSAPGVDIMGCFPYVYGYLDGTSEAAPHVSGLASLLKGYNPELYNDDIEQIIRLSADNIETFPGDTGWDENTGMGRINARKALDLLRPPNYLAHWSVSGGYEAGHMSGIGQCFYGVPGLGDGCSYRVDMYEVRHDVTFPQLFTSTPHAWGRGVATHGWSAANPNFGLGYCDFISVTCTGGTLRTWVYDVWILVGPPPQEWIHIGWWPCSPQTVSFAYSVLGKPRPSGDCNGDGVVTASDVVFLTNYLYLGGPAPAPLCIADVNDDGSVSAADIVYLINYLFIYGPAPRDGCN